MTASFEYAVRADDLDFMRHVGHAQWVTILERARIDLLASLPGRLLTQIGDGIAFVVSRIDVRYLKPATLGERFEVELDAELATDRALRVRYRVRRGEETLIAATTDLVSIGGDGKAAPIPESFAHLFRDRQP